MKNLYIPKGKTLRYEALACRNIVNDGVLIVESKIQARHISGKGVINAGSIACRSLSATDIDAAYITTGKLAAERVCASEVKVSGAAVVSCCLEAAYVVTPKLTVALSEVGEMDAQEVVNLPNKRRGILAALFAGFCRRLWMSRPSTVCSSPRATLCGWHPSRCRPPKSARTLPTKAPPRRLPQGGCDANHSPLLTIWR